MEEMDQVCTNTDQKSEPNKCQEYKNGLACEAATKFVKLYYEWTDKRRHLINKLYMEYGVMVFNGTGIAGKDNIQRFIDELPSMKHTISSFDAQPVCEDVVGPCTVMTVLVTGSVRFACHEPVYFMQDFTVTVDVDNGKCYIVNDCFRLQEPINF